MTKLLLSGENPDGWKLEDILVVLQDDIIERMARVVGDGRGEARRVIANSAEILSLLAQCIERAADSAKILDTLSPARNTADTPRIGGRDR
jgi:hypothetical protein